MSLIIVNRPEKNLFFWRGKNFLKNMTGRQRGPELVTRSLIQGLTELGVDFKFNPSREKITSRDTVYVNESPEALLEMIQLKKIGLIKKLAAGPAITVLPRERDNLMLDENIDIILQPSAWVKDYWVSLAPGLADKIKIWWAGVDDRGARRWKNLSLLYLKNAPPDLVKKVSAEMNKLSIPCLTVRYGHYLHPVYMFLLKRARFMAVLSPSESQGLFLNESWMAGVPTLVWQNKKWSYGDISWCDAKISAPYLNDNNGRFFSGAEDFGGKLAEFINLDLNPRPDTLNNFTHQAVAKNFLRAIDYQN